VDQLRLVLVYPLEAGQPRQEVCDQVRDRHRALFGCTGTQELELKDDFLGR
jgi:hypothetical protein